MYGRRPSCPVSVAPSTHAIAQEFHFKKHRLAIGDTAKFELAPGGHLAVTLTLENEKWDSRSHGDITFGSCSQPES